ncbi:hypothetical protein NQZ68_031174 [Dissostichus eleginoides]|nr:hypothetical protein NQZ68_031174 [Dissostichus eleginoides]
MSLEESQSGKAEQGQNPHQPHPAVVCLFSFFSILDVAQEEAQPLQDTGTGLRADDTTVIGQITDGDETATKFYSISDPASWAVPMGPGPPIQDLGPPIQDLDPLF